MKGHKAMRALKFQVVLGLIAIVIFAFYDGLLPAAYGFLIGVINLFLLKLTFQKADEKAAEDPRAGMLLLYVSAAFRFFLLIVLFILGLVFLELDPLPLVLTFVVMQVGQIFNLRGKQRLTD